MRTKKSGTAWRHANIGRLLNNAVRRFEARVLELMTASGHVETRITHVSPTWNLDVEGTRLTELARRASMSKQAMGELVDQCVDLGLVDRIADPSDGRARIVMFTSAGLAWLEAFRRAPCRRRTRRPRTKWSSSERPAAGSDLRRFPR